MATHAFLSEDAWFAFFAKLYRLVASVHAGDIASSATDTFITVNLREDHRLAVQVMRQNDVRQLLAHEFLQLRDTAGCHVVLQTPLQIIDNPVAVLHDRRADLHIAALELYELQRVAPGLDTADTRYIHVFLDTAL